VGFYSGFYGRNILRPISKIVVGKALISKQALVVIPPIPLSLIRLVFRCNLMRNTNEGIEVFINFVLPENIIQVCVLRNRQIY
jgi:hypothetical protein